MNRSIPDPIELLGVKVHPVTREALVECLAGWVGESRSRRAYYVNAHTLRLASDDPDFNSALNNADLVYCDGFGAKVGAAVVGLALPERLAAPDWIHLFLDRAPTGTRIYLLGDEPGVADSCGARLMELHPQITTVGSHHGFFDATSPENDSIVQQIRESHPQVLLVGMGMPRQELWVENNLPTLPNTLMITVGALMRYVAEVDHRPPRWMTDNGLEWLGRLLVNPRRFAPRYITGGLRYASLIMAERFKRGLQL